MKPFLSLLATLAVFGSSGVTQASPGRGAGCTETVDPQSIQVNWTAFKTMQKVAVRGGFTEVTLLGDLEDHQSLVHLLSQLEAEIDIPNASRIRTGNPGRDLTLFQHFFRDFKKQPRMTGAIHEVKGDSSKGEFLLHLQMNQHQKPILMHYQRDASGQFQATGSFDILDLGLASALQDLHQTCEVLHRGPDGVSKTWSEVEIELKARIHQNCTP